MILITTPIPIKSTPRTLRTLRTSLAHQRSSTGNSTCRSKVSKRNGICVDSLLCPEQFPLWLVSPFSKLQTLSLLSFLFSASIPVKREKHPQTCKDWLHIWNHNIIIRSPTIYGIFCKHIQNPLGWLSARADFPLGASVPRIRMTTFKYLPGPEGQVAWLQAYPPESDSRECHLPLAIQSQPRDLSSLRLWLSYIKLRIIMVPKTQGCWKDYIKSWIRIA